MGFREDLGVAGAGILLDDFIGALPGFGADVAVSGFGTFVISRLGQSDSTSVGSDVGGEVGWGFVCVRRVQDEDGMMGGGFWLLGVGFGGHSRFSFTSSLAESLVLFDMTLVLRGDPVGGGKDWRLV